MFSPVPLVSAACRCLDLSPFSSSPWSPPPWILLLPALLRSLLPPPLADHSLSPIFQTLSVVVVPRFFRRPDRRPPRFPGRARSPLPSSFPDSGLLAILRLLLLASIPGFHVAARTAVCVIPLGAPDLYLSVSLLLHSSPSPAFFAVVAVSVLPVDLAFFFPGRSPQPSFWLPPRSPRSRRRSSVVSPAVPVISVPGPRLRHSDLPVSCSRPACLYSRFFDSGDPPDPLTGAISSPAFFRLLPDPRSRLSSSLRSRPSPAFLALRPFPPIRPFVSRTDGPDLVARPRRVSAAPVIFVFDLRPRHSDPSISRSRCARLYSRFFDLGDRPDPSHRSDLVSGLLPVSSSISDLVFRPSLLSTLSCLPCSAAFSSDPSFRFPRRRPRFSVLVPSRRTSSHAAAPPP